MLPLCSPATEVAPRLAYLSFLRDTGTWGWAAAAEGVAAYVTRQPYVCERAFGVVHECAHYVALSKPWDTRHDVPRGWDGKVREWEAEQEARDLTESARISLRSQKVRFAAKYEGDTSAEEWLEAYVKQRHPHVDKARARARGRAGTSTKAILGLHRGKALLTKTARAPFLPVRH